MGAPVSEKVRVWVGSSESVAVAVKPLIAALPAPALWLLLLGGVSYSAGAVFYAWRAFPYHHALWHVFVLAGSTFHFFAVLLYVIPPALP